MLVGLPNIMHQQARKEKVFPRAGCMGRKGKDGRGGIGEEDKRLWKAFTRDIYPLHPVNIDEEIGPGHPAPPQVRIRPSNITRPVSPGQTVPPKQAPQLDARTEQRFRAGKIKIEGRLDLHGYNQIQAHNLLRDFVMAAHAQRKRCLLVITGKGGPKLSGSAVGDKVEAGILKQKVPQWLCEAPLNSIVLKTAPAVQKDGGQGALYLYLRRDR